MGKTIRVLACICLLSSGPMLHGQSRSKAFEGIYYNAPLQEILQDLKQSYNLFFVHDHSLLDGVKVSTSFNTPSLARAMEKVLQRTHISFEIIENGRILLFRKEPSRLRIAKAKPDISIEGYIHDVKDHGPLPYAVVMLQGTRIGVNTDEDGYFSLRLPYKDSIKLEVSYLGYIPVILEMASRDVKKLIKIDLQPLDHHLDEVTILEGTDRTLQISDGASAVFINPRKIDLLSGLGEPDILRSLQLLPGISGEDSPEGLSIRGGNAGQNLVLFDGITAYQMNHFGLFSSFNNDAIQEVNMYRGGFGARYGGRVSSILHIGGKRADKEKAHLGTSMNLLRSGVTLELPLTFLKNKASLLLASRGSYDLWTGSPLYRSAFAGNFSSYGERFVPSSRAVAFLDVVPDFSFHDFNAKLSYQLSQRDMLEFTYLHSFDKFGYSAQPIRQGLFVWEWSQEDRLYIFNEGASSTWSRQWGPRLYSKTNVAFSRLQNTYDASLDVENGKFIETYDFNQDNGIRDYTARTDFNFRWNEQHTLDFGGQITQQDLEIFVDRGNELEDPIRDSRVGNTYAAYIEDQFRPSPKFMTSLGIRYQHFAPLQQNFFEPRISMEYQFHPMLKWKAAWGKHHQFVRQVPFNNMLDFGEYFWAMSDFGNLDVLAADHFITGLAFETAGFLVNVEAYQKNLSGLAMQSFQEGFEIEAIGTGNIINGGTGISRGIDVLLQKKLGDYTSWISYSLNKTDYTFAEINIGNPFPGFYDQRHQFKWVNSITRGKFDFSSSLIVASGRPYTAPLALEVNFNENGSLETNGFAPGVINGSRLPTYHRLDAAASYKVSIAGKEAKIGLSLYNVYNQRNVQARRFSVIQPVSQDGNYLDPYVQEVDILHQGRLPNLSFQLKF